MADTVRLMHTHMRGDRKFYFYDAETDVEGGIISLSTDHPERIQRAWVMGFRLDENGNAVSLADALAAQTADDSSEEQDEDTSSGGQSSADNGLRSREPESGGDTATERTRSSRSSRTRAPRQRKANSKRS